MRIPQWLTLFIALIVILFGLYRIKLAFEKPAAPGPDGEDLPPPPRRSGLYSMNKSTHMLIGIVYLLLGAGLIATSFGWNPFGSSIGPDTKTPPKSEAPTMDLKHLPPPK